MENNYFIKKGLFGLIFLLIITGCSSTKNISLHEENVWKKLYIESALNSEKKSIKRYYEYSLLSSDFDLKIASDPEYFNELFDQEYLLTDRINANGLKLIIQEKNQSSMNYSFINRKTLPFLYNGNPIFSFTYFVFKIPDCPCLGVGYISIDEKEKKMYFWATKETFFTKLDGFTDFVDIYIVNYYTNFDSESMDRAYSIFKTFNEYQDSVNRIEDLNNFDLFIVLSIR